MAALKYWWEFGSMAADVDADGKVVYRRFRAEIWDMKFLSWDGDLEASEILAGENPFTIEWPAADKFTPILPSVASFDLINRENFQLTDLWTDEIQRYQVRLGMQSAKSGASWYPVWQGWLNSETYEEELYRYAGEGCAYPVTFYASDFNVLKRRKFQDGQGNQYKGLKPLKWYFDTILTEALGFEYDRDSGQAWEEMLSTKWHSVPSTDLTEYLYLNASNFYDEEGVAMTMYEVIEEILRPFGAFMVGRVQVDYVRLQYYRPFLTDYNSVVLYNTLKLPDTILKLTDGRQADTGTAGTEGTFGYEPLKNGLTVTSSRYAYNTLEDWHAEADELDGFIDSKTSEDGVIERLRYSKCKAFNVGGATGEQAKFWHLRSLDGTTKEEVWCALVERDDSITKPLGIAPYQDIEAVFEDTNTVIYPSAEANLRLNMNVKFAIKLRFQNDPAQMPNYFIEGKPKYTIHEIGGGVFFSALELVGMDGTVTHHLAWGWQGKISPYGPDYYQQGAEWRTGPDTTQWGQFLFTVRDGEKIQGSHWINNKTRPISVGGGKAAPHSEGLSVKMPPRDGYLRWTIRHIDICQADFFGDNNQWIWYGSYNPSTGDYRYDINAGVYRSDEHLHAILINDVEITTQDGAAYQLSDEDVVHTSYINMNAESAMEDVVLKVCNAYEEGMAIGNGDLFWKNGDGIFLPIPAAMQAFTRNGISENLEALLVRSYHSNFTGQFARFDVLSQYALPCPGLACQYGQYSSGAKVGQWVLGNADTWYWIRGQVWDCRAGTSRLDCVQISDDDLDLIEIEE